MKLKAIKKFQLRTPTYIYYSECLRPSARGSVRTSNGWLSSRPGSTRTPSAPHPAHQPALTRMPRARLAFDHFSHVPSNSAGPPARPDSDGPLLHPACPPVTFPPLSRPTYLALCRTAERLMPHALNGASLRSLHSGRSLPLCRTAELIHALMLPPLRMHLALSRPAGCTGRSQPYEPLTTHVPSSQPGRLAP